MKVIGSENRRIETIRRLSTSPNRPVNIEPQNRIDHTTKVVVALGLVSHRVDRMRDETHH